MINLINNGRVREARLISILIDSHKVVFFSAFAGSQAQCKVRDGRFMSFFQRLIFGGCNLHTPCLICSMGDLQDLKIEVRKRTIFSAVFCWDSP